MKKTGAILGSAAMALSLLLSFPALAQDIDFGDDSGRWANDGECDDPRFGGTVDSHRMADATDCRTAYEAGEVTFDGAATSSGAVQPGSEIDFGDDSGNWANDGECDDPRFGGSLESHVLADATDCREAYEGGHVEYLGSAPLGTASIDFGADTGSWANDGECDDPRFGGALTSHEYADATDCRAAYEADPSIYTGESGDDGGNTASGDIDFGDDSGHWAHDGECDDPRFGGTLQNHTLADATDCREAYEADPSIYVGESQATTIRDDSAFIGSIDFGDNSSDYANNGECDDPRFTGPGTDTTLLFADRMADADDCRALYAQGQVNFNGVDGDPALAGVTEIDFGDDTSDYANDGRCDDPRFAGPGTDSILVHGDLGHDATDCRALFESGEVYLAGVGSTADSGASSDSYRINFGDDSGSHPHDGECDDPRFQGRGGALELFDGNLLGDATDCRAAYEAGTVTYAP